MPWTELVALKAAHAPVAPPRTKAVSTIPKCTGSIRATNGIWQGWPISGWTLNRAWLTHGHRHSGQCQPAGQCACKTRGRPHCAGGAGRDVPALCPEPRKLFHRRCRAGPAFIKTAAPPHGGKIDLDRTPGHGSQFSLVLPRAIPETDPPAMDLSRSTPASRA